MPAITSRTITATSPSVPVVGAEEPDEISADEIVEADDSRHTLPPGSRLNPWFAQLVHGYCPPAVTHFARHTPPTNFPGREGPLPPTRPTDPSMPIVSPPKRPIT
jgi:hypothetical protein